MVYTRLQKKSIFNNNKFGRCKPNALQFKDLLKKNYISQYMPKINNSNYATDEGHHLRGINKKKKEFG